MLASFAALALLALPALAQEPPAEAPMPEVELRWKRSGATLRLLPPAGEHLTPGAGVTFVADIAGVEATFTSTGAALVDGMNLGRLVLPTGIHGTLTTALCTDDGASCRPIYLAIDVSLDKPRGKRRWTPPPGNPPHMPGPLVLDHAAAMALAAEDGQPLLLDFSAPWCPPCQTMAAEVLHAPTHISTIGRAHLVILDADDPSSWALKDRYSVGGYPTVILTDPEGYELARIVGYPGEQAFLDWFEGAMSHTDTLGARLRALRAADLTHEEAAQLALDLVRAGRTDQAWEALERSDDSEPALRAILALESHPDALRWLVAHRMDDARAWIWDGLPAMKADPDLAAALSPAIVEAARGAEPALAAELFAVLAELASPDDAPTLYAAAAEAMAAELSDDPAHNRGLWSELAWMQEEAGQYDLALATLDSAIHHYPDEFGYHNAKARVLQHLGRLDQAEVEARLALEHAYGDQRLRAATQLGGILMEEGRPDLGIEAIDAVLADFERPAATLEVRTHRYLDQLEAMRGELEQTVAEQ